MMMEELILSGYLGVRSIVYDDKNRRFLSPQRLRYSNMQASIVPTSV
jgi:hypothetical protein